jgi:AbrB family looped-hinge helix DNA binding protein
MQIRADARGRVIIPVSVRRKFGITGGTRIAVDVDEEAGRITLTSMTQLDFIQCLRCQAA